MRPFEPLVLCYHAVSDRWDHTLSVRPAALERQVRFVLGRRYRPAGAADVAGGRGRLLHVTFDDAFRSVDEALLVLEGLGVSATVFACSDHADDGRPLDVPELARDAVARPDELATMTWEKLRELVGRGVEVGSHTASHAHLTRLSDEVLRRELTDSRIRIEDELRRPCPYLAYPYGEHDDRVRAAARAAGYHGAFALPGRPWPHDRFALPRVGLWRRDALGRTGLKTSAARHAVGLAREALAQR